MATHELARWDDWIHYAPVWPYESHELYIGLYPGARPDFGVEYQLADAVAADTSHLHAAFAEPGLLEALWTGFLIPSAPVAGDSGSGILITMPLDGELTIKQLDGQLTIKILGGTVLVPDRGELEL